MNINVGSSSEILSSKFGIINSPSNFTIRIDRISESENFSDIEVYPNIIKDRQIKNTASVA